MSSYFYSNVKNQQNEIWIFFFYPSAFVPPLLSFVQAMPPLILNCTFSSLEQMREDAAEIPPVCQLFVWFLPKNSFMCSWLSWLMYLQGEKRRRGWEPDKERGINQALTERRWIITWELHTDWTCVLICYVNLCIYCQDQYWKLGKGRRGRSSQARYNSAVKECLNYPSWLLRK